MLKILITGGKGQLGNQLKQLSDSYPDDNFIFTDLPEVNITSEKDIKKAFADLAPDWLINCAAYTAVDKSESDAETAMLINATAPGMLAQIANEHNVRMIHISTDYVFDGTHFKPYKEDHPKHPLSVYAQSKSLGEELVMANHPEAIIIRTSWLYSIYGSNFMKTVIRLARHQGNMRIVSDQTGTPTWAGDLAFAIVKSIKKNIPPGIYHFSNEGICSWYDFAKAIIDIMNIDCAVYPISTEEFPLPAKRPFFSVLDKSLYKSTTGLTIPHWRNSLKECIRQFETMQVSKT